MSLPSSSTDPPDSESTPSSDVVSVSPLLEQRIDLPSLIPLYTGILEKLGGPSKKVWQSRYFALFGSYSSVLLYWKSPPSPALLSQSPLAIPSSPPRGRISFTHSGLVSSISASEYLDTQHGPHTFSLQLRTNGVTYFFKAATEEIRFHWRAALELAITEAPEGSEKEPWRLESSCYSCMKPFTFTRRKQQCRFDYHAYCERCMSQAVKMKIIIEPHGNSIKICNNCARRIDWEAENEKRKFEERTTNNYEESSGRISPSDSPASSLTNSSFVSRGSASGLITESDAASEWSDAEFGLNRFHSDSFTEPRNIPRKNIKKGKRAVKKGSLRSGMDGVEEEEEEGVEEFNEEEEEDHNDNLSFPRAETNFMGDDSGQNSPLSTSAPQSSNVPVVKSSYSRIAAKPVHKAETTVSQQVTPGSGHRRKKSRHVSALNGRSRSRSRSRRRSKSMQKDEDVHDPNETPRGLSNVSNASPDPDRSISRSSSYAHDAETSDSINMKLMASRSPATMIVNDNYVIMQDEEQSSKCCCTIS
jgi:hypothetical protein